METNKSPKGIELTCAQCGYGTGEHKWICRGNILPVSCPLCKSYHYDDVKVTWEEMQKLRKSQK